MQVSLPPEFEALAAEMVAHGAAPSVEALAYRVMENYRQEIERLREEIRPAIESLERGEGTVWDAEAFLKEMHRKYFPGSDA